MRTLPIRSQLKVVAGSQSCLLLRKTLTSHHRLVKIISLWVIRDLMTP